MKITKKQASLLKHLERELGWRLYSDDMHEADAAYWIKTAKLELALRAERKGAST